MVEQASKVTELESKQQHDLNVVEQLKRIVADKETKVHVLENEIQQLKLAVSFNPLKMSSFLTRDLGVVCC